MKHFSKLATVAAIAVTSLVGVGTQAATTVSAEHSPEQITTQAANRAHTVISSVALGQNGATPTVSSAATKAPACSEWTAKATFYSVLGPDFNPGTPRKVIGINRGSTDIKARAILADYRGDANQLWQSRSCLLVGVSYLQFRNWKSGLCLDKSEDVPNANGNIVYQYTCTAANNQLWLRQPGGGSEGDWQQLTNFAGGRCLDIHNRQYVNGTPLLQWDCAPNSQGRTSHTQQWNTL